MKISYLSNSQLSKKSANAVHVMHMSEAFSTVGHNVVLHAKGRSTNIYDLFCEYGVERKFEINNVSDSNIKGWGLIHYGIAQALYARRTVKPELCYCRCLISCFFALNLGLKCIVEIHEMPHRAFFKWLYTRIFRHQNTVRVVVISEGLKTDLVEEFGIDSALVAHDGASLTGGEGTFALAENGYINVGYAGGLRPGNGIELIIDLANHFANYKFHVVGGSTLEINEWKRLQLHSNIIWHGRMDPSDVAGFLKACDILLAPYQDGPKTRAGRDTSRWMSPLKIFEYMASGTPFLVSDYPVLREVLSEETAMLIPPRDIEQWRLKLEQLAHNGVLRETLARSALSRLKNSYTWDKRAAKVLDGI